MLICERRKRALFSAKFELNGCRGCGTKLRIAIFGRKSRLFGWKGIREKTPDCVAEDAVASELLSAINREINREFYSPSRSNAL